MTLCQDAPPATCRWLAPLDGCTCALCQRIARAEWWHCVGCDCEACGRARALERAFWGAEHDAPVVTVALLSEWPEPRWSDVPVASARWRVGEPWQGQPQA